jgi:festuclavine dehydrogenase
MAPLTGTILLTGGTGHTSKYMAKRIASQYPDQRVLLASRSGSTAELNAPNIEGVKFDWNNASTFETPFSSASIDHPIDRIYLITPPLEQDALAVVKPFIELSIQKGVKRFLLASNAIVVRGSKWPWGKVHEYLETMSKEKGIDYCVSRPAGFMGQSAIL